jgi:hypothetical protein
VINFDMTHFAILNKGEYLPAVFGVFLLPLHGMACAQLTEEENGLHMWKAAVSSGGQ